MTNANGWLSQEQLRDRIRPANFDPAEVEVVCGVQLDPPQLRFEDVRGLPREAYDALVVEYTELRRVWAEKNLELFGREFPGHNCEHCGNYLQYGVAVRYLPTGQHFVVGETCADERMELGSRAAHEYRLLKMSLEHRAEVARIAAVRAKFYREHPDEAAFLLTDDDDALNDFQWSLRMKLEKYGELTEKQLACITRDVERERKFAAAKVARDEALSDAPALVEGRQTIEGRIKSTKYAVGFTGDSVLKILVEFDDGNRVFGTCPRAIEDPFNTAVSAWQRDKTDERPAPQLKGSRVKFDAKVEPKEEHFGFYSRPTKAVLVEMAREESR